MESVGEPEDLSDYDIHCIMESLQSRNAKRVAQCTLGIKSLLTEIKQQLLDMMAEDNRNSRERWDTRVPLPDSEQKIDFWYNDESSVDANDSHASEQMELKTAATVPIARTPKKHPCPECGRQFSTLKALGAHMEMHESNAELSNSTESVTEQEGETEEVDNDDQKSLQLRFLYKKSNQESEEPLGAGENLQITSVSSKESKKYKMGECGICYKEITLKSMKRHMLLHSDVKPFACEYCDMKYTRKDKLKEHLQRKHNSNEMIQLESKPRKPQKCRKCDFLTEVVSEYREHMRKMHPRPAKKGLVCEICNVKAPSCKELEIHMRKHTGERPFVCDKCGISFISMKNLTRHSRTHVEEPPYKCTFCGKGYFRKSDLAPHERTHTGEKPFQCEICGTRFHDNKHLQRHVFMHSGLKPHQCDVCMKSFSRAENMRAHKKIVHEKQPGPLKKKKKEAQSAAELGQPSDDLLLRSLTSTAEGDAPYISNAESVVAPGSLAHSYSQLSDNGTVGGELHFGTNNSNY